MKFRLHSLLIALSMMLLNFGCSSSDTNDEPTPPPTPVTPELELTLGDIGEDFISVNFTAKSASTVYILTLESRKAAPSAKDITLDGEAVTVTGETPSTHTISGLDYDTDYKVYAVAVGGNDEDETMSDVKSVDATTLRSNKMLRFVESTSTSFTYEITPPEQNQNYSHTYLEDWLFEYMLNQTIMTEGDEFNKDIFLMQILANYGFNDSGTREIQWSAGDTNEWRGQYATIVGGKSYYAIMCLTGESEYNFVGTPEYIKMTTQPTGRSDKSISIIPETVTAEYIQVRMECPSDVRFFFYDLYTKSSYDKMREEKGEEGLMDHLYEYGYTAFNTYTDGWTVNPNTDYTIGILGVDFDGNLFYEEQEFHSLELESRIDIRMIPYERGLLDYYAFNTFFVSVDPYYFDNIDASSTLYAMERKSVVEEAMASAGTTLEEFAANPTEELINKLRENLLKPLPEREALMLSRQFYISTFFTSLEPDTEYCYIITMPDTYGFSVGYATGSTEPEYGGGEATDEYSKYLGTWTLTGRTTEDYTTWDTYTLKIEPLVVNRSYKVSGWSHSNISQEFPFEARFIPSTGKMTIEGSQILGITTLNDKEVTVVMNGLFSYGGELAILSGYVGNIFTASLNGSRLSLFASSFNFADSTYDFATLSYAALGDDGEYRPFEGDEFDIVSFMIDRVSTSYTASPLAIDNYSETTVMSPSKAPRRTLKVLQFRK